MTALAGLVAEADRKAALTGIPHYVLQSGGEAWVCGRGARNALWPHVVCLYETP